MKEIKICKCGSQMVVNYHPEYVYTKSAKCPNCGRYVDYACDLQFWTPKKIRDEEIWSEPKQEKQRIEEILVESPETELPRIMAMVDKINELIRRENERGVY